MLARLRPYLGVALIAGGSAAAIVGGGALVTSWYAARSWNESAEAARAERRILAEAPLWVEDAPDSPDPADPTGVPPDGRGQAPPLRPDADQRAPANVTDLNAPAPRLASVEEIELVEADFRFLDPPEPGAHARLALALRSRADAPSDRITLVFDRRWFEGYEIIGAVPEVLADHTEENGLRYFDFPGLPPQTEATLELHLTATGDDVDPPVLQVSLPNGTLGEARPRTVAPRPRPGPARLISVPRLGIRASVEQTVWEPLPFVAGQILGTAHVSLGNSVLIGHLGGPEGDIFARLSRATPGDEVVAVSRGLEYRFVVSETIVLPKEDISPTLPTDTPRLTLMTCTGRWNPFTDDYSHRLWVIAEPPELAEVTIRANRERAAREEAARREREAAERAAAEQAAAEAEQAREAERRAAESTAVAAEPAMPRLPLFPGMGSAPPPTPEAAQRPAARAAPVVQASPTLVPPRLEFRSPARDGRVPRRATIEGARLRSIEHGHVWLFVRPVEEGGSWYVYGDEIVLDGAGRWKIELEIGGPPNVRHELVVGVIDGATQQALHRWIADYPGKPVRALPEGFQEEARLEVVRE